MPTSSNLEIVMVEVSSLENQKDRRSTHFVVKRTIHAILFCTEDVCLFITSRVSLI